MELAPNDGYILAGLGDSYSETGDVDQAIDYYTRALEEEPGYEATYYNRGLIYEDLGEYELALADFRHACSMNEHFFDACKSAIYACFKAGDTDTALQSANELLILT